MNRKPEVLILGGSGMLGSMLVDVMSRNRAISVTATVQDQSLLDRFRSRIPEAKWLTFAFTGEKSLEVVDGYPWILNAIGITKPLIRDNHAAEIERAIEVNSRMPYLLGRRALSSGARVLQIATDCVYSGRKGSYVEDEPHDALDVYGKTKSLGESFQECVHHLRCSIIGPEAKDFKFLVEWFRRQSRNAQINGFVNHQWNGVTTLQFAKVCEGVVTTNLDLPHVQHVVPSGSMSKAEMLHHFAETFGRSDVQIRDIEATSIVDRTLSTQDIATNHRLWQAAGYEAPPSVAEMIRELGSFDYRAA